MERERFGRYLILDHLIDGGMAKICRARFLGEQADKVVAIKMVQPQFSKDENFRIMFMDEIKTTFGLLHPNIVQTYDYGMHKDQLFVAMEYCDGRNLKEYLDKLKERKFVFPVEISVYIITQVCQGLHYSHTLTDKLTGKDLQIIHRDISPHNIMLTFDGAIKVIDFGIAKTETNSEATQAGTIKGKLSYLAPEYLEGHELDPRYDEFAVGITLWEMLCSRKLFKASNDLAVLKKIQECKVPAPSSINPNVPKELDEIVLRALSKDRNKRFENLDQLNRALIKFLYSSYPDFNSSDLGFFAKELFKEEIKKDREKLFEFGKIDLKPYLDDLKNEQNGGGNQSSADSSEVSSSSSQSDKDRKEEQVLDFGFEEEVPATRTRSRVRGTKVKAGGTSAGVNIDEKFAHLKEGTRELKVNPARAKNTESDESRSTQSRRVDATKTVRRKSSGTKTGTRQVKIKKTKRNPFGKVAALLILTFTIGLGYQNLDLVMGIAGIELEKPKEIVNRVPSSNETSSRENKMAQVIGTKKGEVSLVLKGFDKHKQKVFVDGKMVKVDFLNAIKVTEGETHWIRVETSGKKHFIKKVNFEGGSTEDIEVEDTNYQAYGYLKMSRNCARGSISFNLFGEPRVEKLPFRGRRGIPFPVEAVADGSGRPTTHNIYYKMEGQNIERKLSFDLGEDSVIDFCEMIL
ncbi:serine/threonine-protein kinase [Halobacteriovorax sp. HLS]|uniref:serine/threonine protein kinase n=1 Tax=Halobacteriovorax sp. HLS TaxID=2234000 RepID=UPI000FD823F0|nr:serine/threonine-protein kinase [Halobacteriovorax sp. HLS]